MKRNNDTIVVATVLTGAVLFTAPLAIAESFRADRREAPAATTTQPVSQSVRIGSISHAGNDGYVVALLDEAGQKLGETSIRPNETVLFRDGPAVSARPDAGGDRIAKTSDRIDGGAPQDVALKRDAVSNPVVTFEAYQPRAAQHIDQPTDNVLHLARFGEEVHTQARAALEKALNWI